MNLMSIWNSAANQIAASAGAACVAYFVGSGGATRLKDYLTRSSPIQRTTINLTQLARENRLQEIVGRQELTERLISIVSSGYGLGILLGDPGVGKTAFVHHLACLTAKGKTPSLQEVEIVELKLTKVEGRGIGSVWQQVMEGGIDAFFEDLFTELQGFQQKNKKVIVFLDEIHELLQKYPFIFEDKKTQLGTKGIFILGATTEKAIVEDWQRKSGGAMERRSAVIPVPEMSPGEASVVLSHEATKLNLTLNEIGNRAILILSQKYYPQGRFPDRAIKVLKGVGAWVKDKGESVVDSKAVVVYLAPLIEGSCPESLLNFFHLAQNQSNLELQFQPLFFPKAVPPAALSSLSFILRGTEQLQSALQQEPVSATSLDAVLNAALADLSNPISIPSSSPAPPQPSLSKKPMALVGNSRAVVRDVLTNWMFPFSHTLTLYHCSLQHLLQATSLNDEKTMSSLTQKFLNSLSSQTVIYLDEADELLTFLSSPKPSVSPAHTRGFLDDVRDAPLVRSLTEAGDRLLRSGGLDPQVLAKAAIPLPSPLPSPKTHPLIVLFADLIRQQKISIIIGTKRPVDSKELHSIPLPEMTHQQIKEWLGTVYTDLNHPLWIDHLLFFATLIQSDEAPEDYCHRLLRITTNRQEEKALVEAAFKMARGVLDQATVEKLWKMTESLVKAVFCPFSDSSEPLSSLDLADFLGQYQRNPQQLVWVQDPTDVQGELAQEQIAKALKAQGKSVFTLDPSDILKVGAKLPIDKIVGLHLKRFLEEVEGLAEIPTILIKEKHFRQPCLEKRLRELIQTQKIRAICFATCPSLQREEASSSLESPSSSSGGWLREGISALGLGGLVPQGATLVPALSSDASAVESCIVKNQSLSEEVLVSCLLEREVRLQQPEEGEDLLSPPAKKALISFYTFLIQEEGLKRSPEDLPSRMKSDLSKLKGNSGTLAAISPEKIADHMQEASSSTLSPSRVKYEIDPQLLPLLSRIGQIVLKVFRQGKGLVTRYFKCVATGVMGGVITAPYLLSSLFSFRRYLFG